MSLSQVIEATGAELVSDIKKQNEEESQGSVHSVAKKTITVDEDTSDTEAEQDKKAETEKRVS